MKKVLQLLAIPGPTTKADDWAIWNRETAIVRSLVVVAVAM